MKSYLFAIVAVIAILAVTVCLEGQPAGGGGGRGAGGFGGAMGGRGGGGFGMMGGRRGMVMLRPQTAEPAIAAIEEQVKKLKDLVAQSGNMMGGFRGQGGEMPSQEEMQKMMEDMQKRSEATTAAIDAINNQLMVLKGGMALQNELQEDIDQLEAVK
ncbi:MAG: hypothetical protein P8016_09585, partial [Sedimentisphaerales bacterium]